MQRNPQDQIGAAFAICFFGLILILVGAIVLRLVRWIIGF